MVYETVIKEEGAFLILGDGEPCIRLPTVTLHGGTTIMEFETLSTELNLDGVIRLMMMKVYTLVDPTDEIEFVDLDRCRWARIKSSGGTPNWIEISAQWPPDIKNRTTSLLGAPRHEGLIRVGEVAGYRFKVSAMSALRNGCVATVRGKKGTIEMADFKTQTKTKLTNIEGARKLIWTPDGELLVWTGRALHIPTGDGWVEKPVCKERLDGALSPDGTEFVIGTKDQELLFFSYPELEEKRRFRVEMNAEKRPKWTREDHQHIWSVAWISRGSAVVVGHSWPVIGIYDAQTGGQITRHEGGQHFQTRVEVVDDLIVASLNMNLVSVLRSFGKPVLTVPNTANFGIRSAGFIRKNVLVTECDEGAVRVWDLLAGTMVAEQPCAKNEPVTISDERIVLRDSVSKTLTMYKMA